MKLIFCYILLSCPLVFNAQSPYLDVKFSMDAKTTVGMRFDIEMKFCSPLHKTNYTNWFTQDTSSISFQTLKANEIDCSDYLKSEEGLELINGKQPQPAKNTYHYGNQVFAWEKVLVFRITKISTAGIIAPMYFVLPVRYKSFRTSINLTDIPFRPGSIFFIKNANAKYEKNLLQVDSNFESLQKVNLKKSVWTGA